MDYQITCVCGKSFLVSDKQIAAGPVTCPACGQRLNPLIEGPGAGVPTSESTGPDALPALTAGPAAGTSGDPVKAPADATKRCPFCGEIILAIARKCKHCGEFRSRSATRGWTGFSARPGRSFHGNHSSIVSNRA